MRRLFSWFPTLVCAGMALTLWLAVGCSTTKFRAGAAKVLGVTEEICDLPLPEIVEVGADIVDDLSDAVTKEEGAPEAE